MLVNLACDWGRPSRNWPCAWTPSAYCRFLLSIPRNRFLSTDLQSAFWKRVRKEPSFGFPMDTTNLQALLNDQKAGSGSKLTSHQLAFRLPSARHCYLTDGLGSIVFVERPPRPENSRFRLSGFDSAVCSIAWYCPSHPLQTGLTSRTPRRSKSSASLRK